MKKRYKIFLSAVSFAAGIEAFFRFFPPFGGKVTKGDFKLYGKRSRYMNGNKFIYPDEWKLDGLSQNNKISDNKCVPVRKLTFGKTDFGMPGAGKYKFTWFGHSSVLLQISNKNILIDPVLFKRFFPIPGIGPKRFSDNPVEISELPHIDVVLITHDHHDHLEPKTIKKLDYKVDKYIVPLGVEKHLLRWGINKNKIVNLAWWESTSITDIEKPDDNIQITCTPSRHFSGRRLTGQNRTEYCSYVICTKDFKIFDSGDGSIGKHFEKIHGIFGDFDLAFMECGQYSDKWHYSHMYPEESVMMARTIGAEYAVPVHWGAFMISDHAWDDSVRRYVKEAETENVNTVTPCIGETVFSEKIVDYNYRWWEG